jgi:DNA-binding NtrC family response regulator
MSVQSSAAPRAVLVADDDENIRFLLDLTLRQAGFDPIVAADGRKAVEKFLRHRDEVQIVLLDVNMPGLDGPSALVRIRQIAPHVPCCLMTGNPEPCGAEDLIALGAVCVFAKPFRLGEVLQTLGRL